MPHGQQAALRCRPRPLPPAADIRNEAGGLAYALPPKVALAQVAMTASLGNAFYADAELQLTTLLDLAAQVEPEYLAKVAVFARDRGYMKDTPVVLVSNRPPRRGHPAGPGGHRVRPWDAHPLRLRVRQPGLGLRLPEQRLGCALPLRAPTGLGRLGRRTAGRDRAAHRGRSGHQRLGAAHKAPRLLRKGNPVIQEWLHSPISYHQAPGFVGAIRPLAEIAFAPQVALYHYLHTAPGTWRDYLHGETARLKKYLYALRPLLACLWLERGLGRPPVAFPALLDALVPAGDLRLAIDDLLARKERSKYNLHSPTGNVGLRCANPTYRCTGCY